MYYIGSTIIVLQAPITFVAIFTKRVVPDVHAELPNAAAAKLYETLAMTAMQFSGYIYQALGPQVGVCCFLYCSSNRQLFNHRCLSPQLVPTLGLLQEGRAMA